MPVITIAMHPVSTETKKELISTLTATAARVTAIPESSFIILVNEFAEEAIGCAGRTLKELKAAQSV